MLLRCESLYVDIVQLWHQAIVDVFVIDLIIFGIRIASPIMNIMSVIEYTVIRSDSFARCAKYGCLFILVFLIDYCLYIV